jgi:hypothetical protein
LHQSRPETAMLYIFSFERTDLPRSIMSALMESFGRNRTQAKQFSGCHVGFFKLSCGSDSVWLRLEFECDSLSTSRSWPRFRRRRAPRDPHKRIIRAIG